VWRTDAGIIWEEIQMELKKQERGLAVDMELLERCKVETIKMQTIREATMGDSGRRCVA
jgi:hypothetical protein